MKLQFFYRLDTLQIDAVYIDCKTKSKVFKDLDVYVEVNVKDPSYELSRNRKVILDEGGQVVDTEDSVNPVQPTPDPNPNQEIIDWIEADWDKVMPSKTELLKSAMLRLLGVK